MKKEKSLKIMLVVLVSVVMTIVLSEFNFVYADDDIWGTESSSNSTTNSSNSTSDNDPFSDMNDNEWATPSLENTTSNSSTNNVVADNTTNTSTNDTAVVFNSTTNNTTNSTKNNTTKNSTTSNANSLAKTGIEDSKNMVAIVLVISGIVGIYSFKKVRDYKDM